MNSHDILQLTTEFDSLVFGQESDADEKSSLHTRNAKLRSKPDVVRVLVVEDNDAVRKVICELLLREPGMTLVSEAANGLDGIRLVQSLQPDVVLLDITMPTLGGIEAAVRMRRVAPRVRIVFVSQHNLVKLANAALATGAYGYVLKSSAATDLIPAIRNAVVGKKFMSKMKE